MDEGRAIRNFLTNRLNQLLTPIVIDLLLFICMVIYIFQMEKLQIPSISWSNLLACLFALWNFITFAMVALSYGNKKHLSTHTIMIMRFMLGVKLINFAFMMVLIGKKWDWSQYFLCGGFLLAELAFYIRYSGM